MDIYYYSTFMFMILLISLSLACAAGIIIVIYESLATQAGWPVGRLFRNNNILLIIGGLSVLGAVGYGIVSISLLWGIGILVLGFMAAFILSFLLKSWAQLTAIVLLVVSWLLQILI